MVRGFIDPETLREVRDAMMVAARKLAVCRVGTTPRVSDDLLRAAKALKAALATLPDVPEEKG